MYVCVIDHLILKLKPPSVASMINKKNRNCNFIGYLSSKTTGRHCI